MNSKVYSILQCLDTRCTLCILDCSMIQLRKKLSSDERGNRSPRRKPSSDIEIEWNSTRVSVSHSWEAPKYMHLLDSSRQHVLKPGTPEYPGISQNTGLGFRVSCSVVFLDVPVFLVLEHAHPDGLNFI